MKKVILVHGWGGGPNSDWFIWVKNKLIEKGFEVISPEMPNTMKPDIKEWVSHLNKIIAKPDKDTYLIGHSIGCQAVMRYIEQLPKDVKVGGAIFVAGWFNLTDNTWDENYTREIANPWIETPINFKKIKSHTSKFVAIQSDNDPYVPLSDKDLLKKNLDAKIIILHNKGHISGEDGSKDLPVLLQELLKLC